MKKLNVRKGGVFVAAIGIAVAALGGVDRGGVTFGVMSMSEWMVVGDAEFDSSEALIFVNDMLTSLDALHEGQVLTIDGRLETASDVGVADTISYDDNVTGPISWIDYDADDGLIVALGQMIRVNEQTIYSGNYASTSIYGLSTGMVVEVSGLRLTDDEVLATYIALKHRDTLREITGYIENVDTSARTFEINDLTIKYSSDASINGFVDGLPVDGQLVEARGEDLNSEGELNANYLQRKPILEGMPGTQIVLDGLVTHFTAADEIFRVAGTPIYLADDAQIEDGALGDIENNVRIVIDGQFDNDGVVNVSELRFYYPDDNDDDEDEDED